MNIEKRPSGKYRIRQMVNGKMHSIILDHKPSKVEAEQLMADKIKRNPISVGNMTLHDACQLYIDSRRSVVSASTIKGYVSMVRNIPEAYSSLYLGEITAITVQQFVNEFSSTNGQNQRCKGKRSPKTVSNMSHFLMSVLKFVDINVKSPQLPQQEKVEPYIPNLEEVKKILAFLKDSEFEIPFRLAARGLRKSEILALSPADLNGNYLTINKALVQDENGDMVLKTTKTPASTRTIEIKADLADAIRAKGYVYKGSPKSLYSKLRDVQDALGIQHFGFHKFRHFYASYLYQLGFSPKAIQEDGGWSTDEIMRVVYTHVLNKQEVMHQISNALAEFC